jgi:hypothetical protein
MVRGFRKRGWFVAVLYTSSLIAAPSALASGDHAAEEVPRAVERVTGKGTSMTGRELYKVPVAAGRDVLTHGPDAPKADDTFSAKAAGFAAGSAERSPVCATSDYVHVLYARTPGTPDRLNEVGAGLRLAVKRMNAVLARDAVASGGPTADYRVLCDGGGQIRIDRLISGSSFSQIVSAARSAGFNAPGANYLVFHEGRPTSACGIGSYRRDDSLSASNRNNNGGGYAIAYAGCWYGETAMHELGHNMGAVQPGAPNSTGSGAHCRDEQDVMCYSPDGGDRNQGGTVTRCSGSTRFDCDFNDYFDAAPEKGEWLATHWNLGSPLNRFFIFGRGGSTALPAIEAVLRGRRSARAGRAARPGQMRMYAAQVNRRTRVLRVILRNRGSSRLALVVRGRRQPTARRHRCRRGAGGRAVCRIRNPRPGKWYLGVLTTRGGDTPYKVVTRATRKR